MGMPVAETPPYLPGWAVDPRSSDSASLYPSSLIPPLVEVSGAWRGTAGRGGPRWGWDVESYKPGWVTFRN